MPPNETPESSALLLDEHLSHYPTQRLPLLWQACTGEFRAQLDACVQETQARADNYIAELRQQAQEQLLRLSDKKRWQPFTVLLQALRNRITSDGESLLAATEQLVPSILRHQQEFEQHMPAVLWDEPSRTPEGLKASCWESLEQAAWAADMPEFTFYSVGTLPRLAAAFHISPLLAYTWIYEAQEDEPDLPHALRHWQMALPQAAPTEGELCAQQWVAGPYADCPEKALQQTAERPAHLAVFEKRA